MRDSELLRTGWRPLLGGRRAGLAITGICGALCLLVASCSSSPPAASKGQHGSHHGTTTTSAGGVARVTITPGNGSINLTGNKSLMLAKGSLVSVSGAGLTVPFGQTELSQGEWVYETPNSTLNPITSAKAATARPLALRRQVCRIRFAT